MIPLRPYQSKLGDDISQEHNQGARNVLAQCPTGGGKTVVMAHKAQLNAGSAICIAHRQELVSQISLSLAKAGLHHGIVGSDATIKACVRIQMDRLGRSYFNQGAPTKVAGVDTLVRLDKDLQWMKQVTLWETDEAHHVLEDNKWGRVCALFPNARGIGWTATPERADGKGLGRRGTVTAGAGVMDRLVIGPAMADLIAQGFLTRYKVLLPKNDLDLSRVEVSDATGDYKPDALRKATHESHIVGDIVQHYMRHAAGKLGVTFAVDIDHATEIARCFRAAGVAAEVVTGKTPDVLRFAILRRFERREILQLVNVDLFGEGFDLPAIEVVSFGRATKSYALFSQQWGRVMRYLEGKEYGLILDHVGNTIEHNGPPDRPRVWTLDGRTRSSRAGDFAIPLTACPECSLPYERLYKACPYCGYKPEPLGRADPKMVEGDLTELDGNTLSQLWGEVFRIDGPVQVPQGMSRGVASSLERKWVERQDVQGMLREGIELWAGWRRVLGESDSIIYRRFWYTFGYDVVSAMALGANDAATLVARVWGANDAAGLTPA
jgi:DNA repair protein RadD